MKYLVIAIAASFSFISCKKLGQPDVVEPVFEIALDKLEFEAGEEVVFKLKGNADLVSFYSGEPLHDYEFREGRLNDVKVDMSFKSTSVIGQQSDQLAVLISSDFDGKSDLSSVEAANWIDISESFNLSQTAAVQSSEEVDLSEFFTGKPVFIAFRYTTRPVAEYGTAKRWIISDFQIKRNSPLRSEVLNVSGAGFSIFEPMKATKPSRSWLEAQRLIIQGQVDDFDYNLPVDHWMISSPLEGGVMDIGPDYPIPIKGKSDNQLSEYRYQYDEPGNYDVYFFASNTDIYQHKVVMRKVSLTITPASQ